MPNAPDTTDDLLVIRLDDTRSLLLTARSGADVVTLRLGARELGQGDLGTPRRFPDPLPPTAGPEWADANDYRIDGPSIALPVDRVPLLTQALLFMHQLATHRR